MAQAKLHVAETRGRRRDIGTDPVDELYRMEQALSTKVETLLHELRISEAQRKKLEARYSRLCDWCEGTGFEYMSQDSEDEDDPQEEDRRAKRNRHPRARSGFPLLSEMPTASIRRDLVGLPAASRRRMIKLATDASRSTPQYSVSYLSHEATTNEIAAPMDATTSPSALRDRLWQLYAEPPKLLVQVHQILENSLRRWHQFTTCSVKRKTAAVCKLQAQYRGNCARAIVKRKMTMGVLSDHDSVNGNSQLMPDVKAKTRRRGARPRASGSGRPW